MAVSNKKHGLSDGSAIYFLIKPFRSIITISILFFSFVSIAMTSLLYSCNKTTLYLLLKSYKGLQLSKVGLEQYFSYYIYKVLSWLAFDVTQVRKALSNSASKGLDNSYISMVAKNVDSLQSFDYALQIVSYRIGILVAYSMTILLFVVAVAFFDGWMERKIRTACLGRESSTMYHQAKFLRSGSVVLTCMVFLSWPTYLDPLWLVIFAAVFGTFVWIQAKYYKKYV